MVKAHIVYNTKRHFGVLIDSQDEDRIYDNLTANGIEHELAADAAAWCSLADLEESYNEELFDIYIEEE